MRYQNNKKVLKDKLTFLQAKKVKIEETDEFKKQQEYFKLPISEKVKVEDEWINYYKLCRESESGKSFTECKIAYLAKDWPKVKEFALKARERLGQRNYIPTPKIPGEDQIWRSAISQIYRDVNREISEIEGQLRQMGDEEFMEDIL